MSGKPDLSIILITHEHADDLPRCLGSLSEAMAAVDAELILIDNRSADGSFELGKQLAPEPSTVVQNQDRHGFSANVNRGVELSSGRDLVLLNPDTVVEENALAVMLEYLRGDPSAGLVVPALYFPDGDLQPSRRQFPTWRSFLARRTPLRRWMGDSDANRAHLMLDVPSDEPQEIDWALAACWLVRREAFDQVGGLDEGYPLYVEDIDFCMSLRKLGWKVVYLPSARIEHHHHAVTDSKWLTRRTWFHLRGMGRYARKHGLGPVAQRRGGPDPQ